MAWPLIRHIPEVMNLRYVRYAGIGAALSIFAVLATFASVFSGGFRENPVAVLGAAEGAMMERAGVLLDSGFNLGIDFRGGILVEVSSGEEIDLSALRTRLNAMEIGEVQLQAFDDPRHAAVRFLNPDEGNPAVVVEEVRAEIRSLIPDAQFPRIEVVGPKVSDELFAGGLIALGLAILLMLIYIWFRFEWQFGLGAVLALFHDVILTLGLFSITRMEFNLTIVAALLTIIGYSMNDTVVVFDRLRENLRKYKKMPIADVIDLSINQTLSRTIITGITTLLALLGLLILGGEALSGFAIAMIFGIIVGTYSSLYVAAPAILIWGVKRGREGGKREAPQTAGS
jgi:preprotein translocase SecF subunit